MHLARGCPWVPVARTSTSPGHDDRSQGAWLGACPLVTPPPHRGPVDHGTGVISLPATEHAGLWPRSGLLRRLVGLSISKSHTVSRGH